jgi:hypothetical protein
MQFVGSRTLGSTLLMSKPPFTQDPEAVHLRPRNQGKVVPVLN